MATRVGAALTIPRAGTFDGVSRNASGVGTANGWTKLAVFPGSRLPRSSANVAFVVMGTFGNLRVDNGDYASVELMLASSGGQWFTSTRHSYHLHDGDIGYGGARGATFMLIMDGGTWADTTDLELHGRIFDEGNFNAAGLVEVSQVIFLAFDLGNLGASNYVLSASAAGSTTLPYESAGDATLHTTGNIPWTSGTEQWLTFYTSKVRAENRFGAYTTFMQLLQGGSPSDSWNETGAGTILRGGDHRTTTNKGYWMGGLRVFPITAANFSVRVRGRCRYVTGNQAVANQAIVFAVRVDDLEGFNSDSSTILSLYGLNVGHGNGPVQTYKEWTIQNAPVRDLIWLSSAKVVGTTAQTLGVTMELIQNETRWVNDNLPMAVYSQGPHEGPMQYSGGLTLGHEGLNFFEHRGFRHEWESRGSMSVDTLVGGYVANEVVQGNGIVLQNITGTFTATETIRGTTSGATAVVLAGAAGPGSATVPVGSHYSNFLNGETATGLSSGATATVGGIVATATVFNFYPVTGTGGRTLIYGRRSGTFVTNQTVQGQTSGARARFLSLFEPATSSQAQYWQTLIFGMHRGSVSTPVPDEVAGPYVIIVPAREAPSLASLTELPLQPSFTLRQRLVNERTEMRTWNGYTLTSPKFATIRSEREVEWRGITKSQRDSLVSFFAALGQAVFKWQPPDKAMTAWALVGPVEWTDIGKLHTGRASIVELVWVS